MTLPTNSDIEEHRHPVLTTVPGHWELFLFQGVLMLIFGMLAIALPNISTLEIELLVGWLFIVGGFFLVTTIFKKRHMPGFWWSLLSGVLADRSSAVMLRSSAWPYNEFKPARFRGATILSIGFALTFIVRPINAQPTQVERGEYLARVGDCISCHTVGGGPALAGGDRLNTPFGYMLAPNITPDTTTGIGLWSSDDFYRALHEGVDRAGEDMYPAMPYDFYTKVTRSDIDAIYAYLRTVTPVTRVVDVNHLHFPFDERWTMGAWRELYFTEGTFTPNPLKSKAWNRGAYLIEGLAHCSDCHSPRNLVVGSRRARTLRAQSSTAGSRSIYRKISQRVSVLGASMTSQCI